MITLRGITWAHSRGVTPLLAAAQAWHDLHPEVTITWDQRSFWGFGEGPLDEVSRDYDLVVFDHPHTGEAAHRGLLLPLDELASATGSCAGPSRESYECGGALYGLPIDAACQAAAYRADLLEEDPPTTWAGVLSLARRTGQVRCSFSPMGTLGMFHSLTASLGAPAGRHTDHYVVPGAARDALDRLAQLFAACGPESLQHSPPRILAALATTGDGLYAPLVYGYANYCRQGFAPHPLRFAPPPIGLAGAVLGGAGLGIPVFTRHRQAAFDFAAWLISPACQLGLYFPAQGQPALRAVWEDAQANALTGDFFRTLLPVMDLAYVRPTHAGFPAFQSRAARLLHAVLLGQLDPSSALDSIDQEYRHSCPA
ncbi:MAG TPA: hypothetical protein DEH78_00195 [Solibacterales bacterium]|nr:hypothetical protein [Bryobacterales bacterium]